MIQNNNSVEWISIEDKLKKEWKKRNGKEKEKKESNIINFKEKVRSFKKNTSEI